MQGMNSEVWLARDLQHDGEVAVKEIPKANLRRQGIADFFQEAKMMFDAQHPENVVPILYAGDIPNRDCVGIAMPYYPNGSLHDRIASGPLSLLEVVRVGLAMLNGLGSIHSKDLFHFDLKPSNIFFDSQDVPLVADFGQARAAMLHGKVPLPAMYPFGVPPEIYGSRVGSRQTDIYLAGVTLYRAVNGNPFFDAQKAAIVDLRAEVLAGKFPRRDRFQPHVPRQLRTLIRKAMSVDEADRFRSASDMLNALANCPIKHDWIVTPKAGGECAWECPKRGAKTGFSVELSKDGKNWRVDACTVGAGRRRCKDKCLSASTRSVADAHLKKLFQELD